jgi:hypothetical protein
MGHFSTKSLLERHRNELADMVPTQCVLVIGGREFPVFLEQVQRDQMWALDKFKLMLGFALYVQGEAEMMEFAQAIHDSRRPMYVPTPTPSAYSTEFDRFLMGWDDG